MNNELVFTQLICFKLDDCAEWWVCHREEGLENFKTLSNLILVCENLKELSLSWNDFNEDQIVRVITALRNSPSVNSIEVISLDGNKPKPSICDHVRALVQETSKKLLALYLLG